MITRVSHLLRGNAFLLVLDQSIVSAANFVTSVIVARACAKEEFGLYFLAFTFMVFLINIQVSLISTAFTVFSPRLEERARAEYSGSALLHQITLAALITLALAGLGTLSTFGAGPDGLDRVLWALTASAALLLLKEFVRHMCFARFSVRTVLFFDTGVSALQVGGLLLLAFAGHLAAGTAFLVLGPAAGSAALFWLVAHRRSFSPQARRAWRDFVKNWAFSRWIFGYNVSHMLTLQAFPWLLIWLHGAEANAALGAALGVINFANPFLLGVGNFLGPGTAHAYAEGGKPALRRVVRRTTWFLGLTHLAFLGLVLLCGGWIVVLIYGGKFSGLHTAVSILAVNQLAWALLVPIVGAANALGRSDIPLKGGLIGFTLTLTLGSWLVWRYGLLGAAGGLTLAHAATGFYLRAAYARVAAA